MSMFLRTLRFTCRLIIPGSIIIGGIAAANAQSEEVKQACTPDAMRLCGEFIPDRAKITRCMMSKRSQISAPCLTAMRSQGSRHGRRVASHHRHGHHARHRHYD